MIQDEEPTERDANKYFFVLKMALDVGGNKLKVQILSYLQVRF